MAVYPIQNPAHAGGQIAFTTPPASGDSAPCGATIALLVVNPGVGAITVSLPLLADDGLVVGPRVVSVAAGQTWAIPLLSGVYGTSVTLTYTGTLTSVGVAVVALTD